MYLSLANGMDCTVPMKIEILDHHWADTGHQVSSNATHVHRLSIDKIHIKLQSTVASARWTHRLLTSYYPRIEKCLDKAKLTEADRCVGTQ